MTSEKLSSFLCTTAEIAIVRIIFFSFLSTVVINNVGKKNFRLSGVTVNKNYEVYVHSQIKKCCLLLHEHATNPDTSFCVNGKRSRIHFLCESECFLNLKTSAVV